MRLTEVQLRKIENCARQIYKKNNDPFHQIDHAFLTAKIAVSIARQEKADIDVCRTAGLLHDIAPKTRGKAHGEKSAQMAKRLLKKIKVDPEVIKSVYLAICNHDTINRRLIRTKEGEIIFEADKLQAMGPIGLIREYGDLLMKGHDAPAAFNQLISYLKNYSPQFTTKTGKRLQRVFRDFNSDFLKLYNQYFKL